MSTDLQALINDLHAEFADLDGGNVASYIPELARADPNWFGIAIVTCDGQVFKTGDHAQQFTIQSMSKAVTYGLALEDHGRDYLLERIGVEPTGKSFNSVVLDERTGRPFNPMVNAGAIAVAEIINGESLTDKLHRVTATFNKFIGRSVHLDGITFMSERATGDHNRAIAHLMRASHVLTGDIDDALDLYFQQCSLLVDTVDIATMAATFANKGINPITQERALQAAYISDVLSVMYTCGMYDTSGMWSYRVGLPAKSGVSGGIFAVVPGHMGIAAFSPPLDAHGHSVRSVKAIEALASKLCLHIFNACEPD